MSAAVIFDCDGVLVESETLIAKILVRMTNDLGGNLTLTEGLRLFHGAQLDLCVARIAEYLGRDVTADIAAEYQRRSAEIFRNEITAIDGVDELIRSLIVPTCVVSNSSREKLILNLEATGLIHHFGDRVYSACDLSRWKPEPDIYLHAAARLDFDPSRCIAIEDSVIGVQSAAQAGMAVIGFGRPDLAPDLRRSGARWTCQTMSEVQELVHVLTHPLRIPTRKRPIKGAERNCQSKSFTTRVSSPR